MSWIPLQKGLWEHKKCFVLDGENGFVLLDNLSVALPIAAGERTSTTGCQSDLCAPALSITDENSQMEERHQWFFSSPCGWGPSWWQQVGMWLWMFGVHNHPCIFLQSNLIPGQSFISQGCHCTARWVKRVLLPRVVISAGISEEGEGMWVIGCLCR